MAPIDRRCEEFARRTAYFSTSRVEVTSTHVQPVSLQPLGHFGVGELGEEGGFDRLLLMPRQPGQCASEQS